MRNVSFFLALFCAAITCSYTPLHSCEIPSGCHCTPENHCGCIDGGECTCGPSEATQPDEAAQPDVGYVGYDDNVYAYADGYGDDGDVGYEYNADSDCCYPYDYSYLGYGYGSPYGFCLGYGYGYCGCCCCDECDRYCWPTFMPCPEPDCWPCCMTGAWMPERPPLFRPFIADPRELTYSAGWRFNDNAFTKNVIDVSYFDTFPIYGWCNVFYCGDKLQADLDGCLWAVFDPCTFSSPLMNADYYCGLHMSYLYRQWSYRARVFHISSHVGDEFLLNHPHFVRHNPSAEYVDFFASYQHSNELRVYGGLGWVIEQDESFCTGRFYAEAGMETRICSLGWLDRCERMYGVPFFAFHFRYRSDFKRHVDMTYALGYEVGKLCGLEHRLRVYMEYHDGYSVEGQWSCTPTNYFSIRAQYGF